MHDASFLEPYLLFARLGFMEVLSGWTEVRIYNNARDASAYLDRRSLVRIFCPLPWNIVPSTYTFYAVIAS
jgi:hypothetical protein